MKTAVLIIIVFTAILSTGLTKKLKGVINEGGSRWRFLTRFCFLSLDGRLTYDFAYPVDYGIQNLLFYYDTPGQWESAYRHEKTCEEKVDVMKGQNIFPLNPTICGTETRNGRLWYRCRNAMGFRSARERWWFMVVERCGAPASGDVSGLFLEYDIHMTNGDDLMHKEFSADQFYILPVDIVFFILYMALLAASIIVAVLLVKKHMYHTTYKMYLASVSIWTISLLFLVIAWGSYGNTGWERSSVEVFGRILQTASTIIFIQQLVLMAKGYTIVRGRLTNKATLKITIFILLYSSVTIALFAWEAYNFDPGLVLYYYESPPGYCLIGMQLLGWLWMTKAAVFTLKHYSKSTSGFYIPFYIIYSVWFWTGPVVTMLAMMCMPKWQREKTVHGVQQLIALLGHLFFFVLTLPCKVNSNFPFNIKTSQIGDVVGGSEDDAHNMYALSSNVDYSGTGPNLDIFVTSSHQPQRDTSFGERTFGPLDASILNSNNIPPPGYSEATNSKPLPPVGGQEANGDLKATQENHSDTLPNNHLPPIGGQRPREELRLPPIRASGLPPLVPSAPAQNDDDDDLMCSPPPPSYAEMFQTNKQTT